MRTERRFHDSEKKRGSEVSDAPGSVKGGLGHSADLSKLIVLVIVLFLDSGLLPPRSERGREAERERLAARSIHALQRNWPASTAGAHGDKAFLSR
jgi:hypothetical protein